MHAVVLETNGIGDLDGHGPDPDIEIEMLKLRHDLAVEVRHATRREREGFIQPIARCDRQSMFDEIEFDLEPAAAIGNQGRRQSPVRDIERNLPPMIDVRRTGETDLANDLRPHMKRVAGVLPGFIGKSRPRLVADFAYSVRLRIHWGALSTDERQTAPLHLSMVQAQRAVKRELSVGLSVTPYGRQSSA